MSQTAQEIRPLRPQDVAGLRGVEILRGMVAGHIPRPPFSVTTRTLITEVEEGRVVFEGDPQADFVNPMGMVHGGWVAAILDSAMACAIHSCLDVGQSYTTLELKVNYVRAVTPEMRRVRCEGRMLHVGGRVGTAEGKLIDMDTGKLLAHGTETCMIFSPPAKG